MPIKIQGHSPTSDSDPESDASERRNRTAASAVSVKHTITGGRDFYGS